jgi:FtsP/CotA-like multicopper oxidase with cupredoxin domain
VHERCASRGDDVAEVELVAAPATRVVAGKRVDLLAYNGVFPGPLLRFREGDRVRIRFINRLGEPTNLHLHGLHIPPATDDPMRLVADGDTAVYEFELLPGSAGTYWYHPHGHGSVGPQLFAGLAGPMIVDGRDDPTELAIADERILVLKDLTIDGSSVSPHSADDWLNGKEGELVLVNGAHQPHIDTSSGVLRLRLVNACNARYLLLAVEGHPLTVLGAGTGFAETSRTVDTLLLAPGERADVLAPPNRGVRVGRLAL